MDKNKSLGILESCIRMLKDMSDEEFAKSLMDKNLHEYEDSYYAGDNFNVLESSASDTIILSTRVTNFNVTFGVNKPNFYGLYEAKGEHAYIDVA